MDQEFLIDWKLRYRNVYCATLGEQECYFRALSLQEIEDIDLITSTQSSADAEDLYVKTAVLYPVDLDLDKIKPGYVTSLAEEIKGYSGISDISDIVMSLQQSREFLNFDIFNSMKAFVLSAMPQYTEEDLSQLTIQEMIHKVVMAERILSIQQSVNGIQSEGVQFTIFSDEPEPQQKKAPQKAKVTKEELLRRIKKDEMGMIDENKVRETDQSQLQNFDEDLLLKAAGVLKPEDPIARKLREAMGG
jgi:hypothetical protein